MKSLLLIAHGSRRAESNSEIVALTEKLRTLAGNDYAQVVCAFLELADPSIEASIDLLVDAGETHIVCLPYFLAKGAHVASDIPEAIESARNKHPDVTFTVSGYLGASEEVPSILIQLATQASKLEAVSRT